MEFGSWVGHDDPFGQLAAWVRAEFDKLRAEAGLNPAEVPAVEAPAPAEPEQPAA